MATETLESDSTSTRDEENKETENNRKLATKRSFDVAFLAGSRSGQSPKGRLSNFSKNNPKF